MPGLFRPGSVALAAIHYLPAIPTLKMTPEARTINDKIVTVN
jgi:hypothetical protein